MRYLSIFSGVEAATVAWEPLGWEPVAFCEVDRHASEVLAARFPHVPNLGDITEVDWSEFNERYGAVDVVVGGSPCQSFSIAGTRTGLEGESRLMYEYIRCVREVVPRYFVWENVPGCLSSNRGGDFGCLLDELEKCGYGMAWRTFDAQFARVPGGPRLGFFGPVPQRRRRVFLVGSLGSPGAAEILFERTCLRGDHPKGREAREALAGDPAESVTGGYCAGAGEHAVLTPWDVQSKRVMSENGTSPTLQSGSGEGMTIQPVVLQSIAFAQNTRDEVRIFGGDGQTVGALAAQPGMKQTSYVCVADDNAKAAIDVDQCGSLKVGGGCAMNSNGEMVVGALCARDYKGIGNQDIGEGKVICQRRTC